MVRFGRAICGDLVQAERREWWLANGRGGYAAGTIAGSMTRRYHGLLIAPVDAPLGRRLVWAKADAELVDGDRSWPLFTNRWGGGTISPAGHVHIESFHLDGGIPVWLFAVGLIRLEARVWLEPGADTAYAAWRLLPGPEQSSRKISLRVRLMVNDRDHHGQTAAGEFAPVLEAEDGGLRVCRPDFALTFRARRGVITPAPQWIENFDLPVERERGLTDRDNHLQVGEARLDLVPGEWVGIVGSLEARSVSRFGGSARTPAAVAAGSARRGASGPRNGGAARLDRAAAARRRQLHLCPAAARPARRQDR